MDWNIEQNDVNKQKQKVKKLRILLSITLAFVGLTFLFTQLAPLAYSYFKGYDLMSQSDETLSPVPGSYKKEIDGEVAYYDPGKSYWQNFLAKATQSGQTVYSKNGSGGKYESVIVNTEYKGELKVSIPEIDITNLRVAPNVESYDENVYNKILKGGLAHFKGTPIPGDGGNAFIYGHSAVEQFFKNNKNDPEVAFSKLEKIEIGDKVEISRNDSGTNEKLSYTVRKKKIVEPTDFSILNPINNKETITLMTCWPNGLGTKRLIVIAYLDA